MRSNLKLLILFCLLFLLPRQSVDAAFFKFSPESPTVVINNHFEITLSIDTETDAPTVADAIVIFNSAKLKLIEAKEPSINDRLFPKFFKRMAENKLYVGGAIEPGTTAKPGRGTLSTLVFEALAPGTATITLACEKGKTTDSNIAIKLQGKVVDVLDCQKLNSVNVTVSESTVGVTGTPTPGASLSPSPRVSSIITQTPTPRISLTPSTTTTPTVRLTQTPTPSSALKLSPSPSPTPSQLPQTGEISATAALIKTGLIFAAAGLIIKLFILK